MDINVGDTVEITNGYPSCGILKNAIGQRGKILRIDEVREWEIAEVQVDDGKTYLVQTKHLKKV